MPTPLEGISKQLRSSLSTGGALALAQPRDGGDATKIFARASLNRAEITETYSVRQEISKNRWAGMGDEPAAGRIELAIPYDGFRYLTRQAKDDIARGLARHPEVRETTAVVGRMLLSDYGKTSLGENLHLVDSHGSVPIEIPVRNGDADSGELDYLTADRQTSVTRYDYSIPTGPNVLPVQMHVDIRDPDSLDLAGINIFDNDPAQDSYRQVGQVISKITKQVGFKNELLITIVVSLHVPARKAELAPKVAKMAIAWPTITSINTLQLNVVNLSDLSQNSSFPLQYNPVSKCLEWQDIPMHKVSDDDDQADEHHNQRSNRSEDRVTGYETWPMLLSINYPGELYLQPTLDAHAEVEIPDYLLSGTQARLYAATGHLSLDRPELLTRIAADAELIIDDAFAKREFSPVQHLHFDEIIPDDLRITDITTALEDRGFEVKMAWPPQGRPALENGTYRWLQVARRRQGPDSMDLWVYTEGRRFKTEREIQLPGGVIHKTELDSGELKIFVRGALPGDSEKVTHEMNVLQRSLRERYDRVRQRR